MVSLGLAKTDTENDMELDNIDTSEDILLQLDGILGILLKDHTTGENIIWATDDYSFRGDAYGAKCPIREELITGENATLIQPRVKKERDTQLLRSRNKAEVFTPAWVCNKQNNLIDEAWFGKSGVFNTEKEEHSWTDSTPLVFPDGKTLNAYVNDVRLELTCGEAPYLVSRYDTTTGLPIPIGHRIGLLDRKLWAINSLTPDDTERLTPKERKLLKREWRRKVYRAYQSIYGFEWQGDNLLLAREALFVSFVEYYQAKWKVKKLPEMEALRKVAEIISWNIWQMDGLSYGIPGFTPTEMLDGFFVPNSPQERLCRVMHWSGTEPLKGEEEIFMNLLNPQKC